MMPKKDQPAGGASSGGACHFSSLLAQRSVALCAHHWTTLESAYQLNERAAGLALVQAPQSAAVKFCRHALVSPSVCYSIS